MQIQVARPASDDQVGGWTPRPLWQQLKGVTANVNAPIVSSVNPSQDLCEMKLQGLAWPSPGVETLTVQMAGDGATDAMVVLLQGSTIIAGGTFTPTASFANYTLTLTAAEVAQISNYTDLNVEVIAGGLTVPCCANPVPPLLFATITNVSGCSCMAGKYPLIWTPPAEWHYSGPLCNFPTMQMNLGCPGNNCSSFLFGFNCANGTSAHPSPCSCSPFSLTITGMSGWQCCDGIINVTITP